MYNLENVIAKINKDRMEKSSNIISSLNNKLINDVINNIKYNKKYCRQLCNAMFNDTKDFVINLIKDKNKDIADLTSQIVLYYVNFYKCIEKINSINKNFHFPINSNILKEEIFNLIKSLVDRNSTIRLLEKPYDKWIEDDIIFSEFNQFSEIIGNCNLSKDEQFYAVMDIIWRNANLDLTKKINNNSDLSFYSIISVEQVGFTDKEAIDVITNDEYLYLITSDDSDLSELEKKQKKVLLDSIKLKEENSIIEISSIIEMHNIIKEHYFDKLDQNGKLQNFDEESFDKVISALKGLGVTNKFVSIARNILRKQLVCKDEKKIVVPKVQQIKMGITDSEYKEIRKEIEQYFNIHDGKVIKPLCEEDVLYCASLMLKIDISTGLIKTLFDRGLKKIKDPIERYKAERDKLIYYQESYGIGNQISEMDEIYEEAIVALDDDKTIWRDMLSNSLQNIESKLPKYEYELKKAKEYKKTNNAKNNY